MNVTAIIYFDDQNAVSIAALAPDGRVRWADDQEVVEVLGPPDSVWNADAAGLIAAARSALARFRFSGAWAAWPLHRSYAESAYDLHGARCHYLGMGHGCFDLAVAEMAEADGVGRLVP